MSANPSAANVANNLISQIVHYDAAFIPPLMANTAAFVWAAEQREQGLHTGVNRTMFTYDLITDTIPASADGVIGSPEYFGQSFVNAQVAEYNAFANFSAFSAASSLDPNQAKSTAELLAYQLGITINNLAYTGLNAQSTTDTTVNPDAYACFIADKTKSMASSKKLLREAEHMARLLIYGGEKDVAVLWVPS